MLTAFVIFTIIFILLPSAYLLFKMAWELFQEREYLFAWVVTGCGIGVIYLLIFNPLVMN